MINKLLPPKSLRRRAVAKVLRILGYKHRSVPSEFYNSLVFQEKEQIPLQLTQKLKNTPLISVVIPVYNAPNRYLSPLIYSIVSQTYSNWELILVDGSTTSEANQRVKKYAEIDKRIHVIKVKNRGISANTNKGLDVAQGEFVAFADHDDVLEENALFEVAKAINAQPDAGLIYTDEDKISEDGERYFAPHFKPDWSPHLLLSVNYITHLVVVRRSLLDKSLYLDSTRDGAQDYDFLLRLMDKNPKVVHIPQILYHWREAINSTAKDFSSKPNITRAGKAAIEDHLARNKLKASVTVRKDKPGFYNVVYDAPKEVTVIVTPFCKNSALIGYFAEVLAMRTTVRDGMRVRFVVPDFVQQSIKDLNKNVKFTFVPADDRYLEKALQSASPYSVILNRIVLPRKRKWLESITGALQDQHIIAVAPTILNNSNFIEDNGLVWQDDKLVSLFHNALAKDNQTFFGATDWDRDVDAVSGAIAVVRSKELLQFMERAKYSDTKKLLCDFSSSNPDKGVVVFGSVYFDNHAIRYDGYSLSNVTRANPALQFNGGSQDIITPESAIETILRHLKQREEDKVREA
jgi:glycosyltransferase involved in cell wall biosynthesis